MPQRSPDQTPPSADKKTATLHIVVALAVSSDEAWLPTMQALPVDATRNIEALLRGMRRVQIDVKSLQTLSPPHERAAALAIGLADALKPAPDGLLPWAALDAVKAALPTAHPNSAWGFVTPCHWAMGREHATLTDPAALKIEPLEADALIAAMWPYFETDGITLHAVQPGRWLAEGEIFRSLPTASLDRVLGRNVDPWLPMTASGKIIKRLQNEMQMLLYTHAVNDARSAERKLPVNSFWLSGTGALRPDFSPENKVDLHVTRSLLEPAFAGDWAAYAAAWQALDTGLIAEVLAQQQAGRPIQLSLCGERGFETWESSPASWQAKAGNWLAVKGVLASRRIYNGREQL